MNYASKYQFGSTEEKINFQLKPKAKNSLFKIFLNSSLQSNLIDSLLSEELQTIYL